MEVGYSSQSDWLILGGQNYIRVEVIDLILVSQSDWSTIIVAELVRVIQNSSDDEILPSLQSYLF